METRHEWRELGVRKDAAPVSMAASPLIDELATSYKDLQGHYATLHGAHVATQEKLQSYSDAMTEVLKRTALDREALTQLFDGAMGDLRSTVFTRLRTIEADLKGAVGDNQMAMKLCNCLTDDIEKVEKELTAKIAIVADREPAPLPAITIPKIPSPWPSWSALAISILTALAQAAIHFIK